MSPLLGSFGGASSRGFRGFRLLGPTGSPSSLSVNATNSSGTFLVWSNGDATSSTQIYRNGNLLSTVGPGITTFSDSGLSSGTYYSYYVRHIKNGILSLSTSNTFAVYTCEAYGVLIAEQCDGYNLYYYYADGNCGSYSQLIQNNSPSCLPARSELIYAGSGACSQDGMWDDTYGQSNCCSGAACSGSTTCCSPQDWGNGWASCAHMCGSGCVYDYGFPGPYYYCS